VTGYRLFTWSEGQWSLIAELDSLTLTFELAGFSPGNTYRYEVRALNELGEGEGTELTFEVAGVPGEVNGLRLLPSVGNITLLWSDSMDDGGSPIHSYLIYRAEADGAFHLLAILPVQDHDYLDTGLDPNISYRYHVAAMNEMGTGNMSDVVQGRPLPIPEEPEVPEGNEPVIKASEPEYEGLLIFTTTAGFLAAICGMIIFSRQARGNDKRGRRRRR